MPEVAEISGPVPFNLDELNEKTLERNQKEVPRMPWTLKKVWNGLAEPQQDVAHKIALHGRRNLAELEAMELPKRTAWQDSITALVDANVASVIPYEDLLDDDLNGIKPKDARTATELMDRYWQEGRPPKDKDYAYEDALIDLPEASRRYIEIFTEKNDLTAEELRAFHVTLDDRFSNLALRKGK